MKLAIALAAACLTACSSPEPRNVTMRAGAIPAALSAYCTATTTKSVKLMHYDAGGWSWSPESSPTLERGSKVLLEPVTEKFFAAYVFDEKGTVWKVLAPSSVDLLPWLDFTTECPIEPVPADRATSVLLTDASFHENQDLTGASCKLSTGTELTNPLVQGSDGTTVTFTARELETNCGLSPAHSRNVAVARLIKRE
jgi:hypothetical protein